MSEKLPLPSKAALVQQFVGKSLRDIPLPAAIVDIAAVKRNCKRMSEAVEALDYDFLPLVNVHKTTEITRLQIGEDPDEVRLMVKTLSEAENLLPLLLEYQKENKQVSILYGVPIPLSQVERIANLARILGIRGGNVRLLVEHVSRLELAERISQLSGQPVFIYINVDVGDHHSGVPVNSVQFKELFSQIEKFVLRQGPVSVAFPGFYCHMEYPSPSYDDLLALSIFLTQLLTLLNNVPVEIIRYSVNATPIIPYMKNVQVSEDEDLIRRVADAKDTNFRLSEAGNSVEVHSADYVLLDLDGIHRNMRLDRNGQPSLTWNDLPLTILTEVSCLYPGRGKNGWNEALVSAGYSALGPKSRHSETGGLVANWNLFPALNFPVTAHTGWQVGRVDAESAILVWKGEGDEENEDELEPQHLEVGQRLRIYPNDAASASQGFGWYFVVDSARVGREDEIMDIFVRWRD